MKLPSKDGCSELVTPHGYLSELLGSIDIRILHDNFLNRKYYYSFMENSFIIWILIIGKLIPKGLYS